MTVATLSRMAICGTCSWLIWAAPSEARFLQVDPVGYEDQINLYAYVANDPVNHIDPTGRDCIVVGRNMACDYNKGRSVAIVPAPPGAFSFRRGDSLAHSYDRPVVDELATAAPPGRKEMIAGAHADMIAANPTPGIDRPATRQGTSNNASPAPGASAPVKSYLRSGPGGRAVTVNVTQPGHPLGLGVVIRWVEVTRSGQVIIHNEGQGVGLLQSRWMPGFVRNAFNNVWIGTTQQTIGQ